jgi:hypothetical protein
MSYKILYITLRRLIGERDVAACAASCCSTARSCSPVRCRSVRHAWWPTRCRCCRSASASRAAPPALPLRDAMKPLCIGGSQRLHMQPWSPAVLAMRHA